MLAFDLKVPSSVIAIQKWVASIITRPLSEESQMQMIAPSGRLMSEEAAEFILPNRKLSADKRIQIYNQQYWWRLLSILQDNFPALTRIFGYTDFNRSIGVPFLMKYTPHHWALSALGCEMTCWIEEEYDAADKPLIHAMAVLDLAYQNSFTALHVPSVEASLQLLTTKLRLQEHVKLFSFPFDALSFRSQLVQESVEFWIDADFPVLPKNKEYFFLLYRSSNNLISYKTLEKAEWVLLHDITKGLSIEEACDHLEKMGGELYTTAQLGIEKWIQEWLIEKLLTNI